MRSLLVALALAATGCVVVPPGVYVRGAPPPRTAPPQPAARLLSEEEAIDVAGRYAASRGIQVDRVKHAHLDGDGRWHVELRGRGHEKAKVIVDARTGQVLKADVKAGHGKHGRDDEDDD